MFSCSVNFDYICLNIVTRIILGFEHYLQKNGTRYLQYVIVDVYAKIGIYLSHHVPIVFLRRQPQYQPDSQGLHLRYPRYGTTANTLTQAGHVAPRFWVPRGAAKHGRGGKGSFVYKRVNY